MINVVPYDGRRLTLKSRRKILKMFPNQDINLIEIKENDPQALKWTERVARFFKEHGVNTYITLKDFTNDDFMENIKEIGVNFVIVWKGCNTEFFVGSFFPIMQASMILRECPNSKIVIRYEPFKISSRYATKDEIETSLEYLFKLRRDNPYRISIEFCMPHPWSGRVLHEKILDVKNYIKQRHAEGLMSWKQCGSITILPNTNIYKCEYMKRRKRKQFFGNADRDKNVLGTLRRGFFRTPSKCNFCGLRTKRG